jgi:hypothetical protein
MSALIDLRAYGTHGWRKLVFSVSHLQPENKMAIALSRRLEKKLSHMQVPHETNKLIVSPAAIFRSMYFATICTDPR